MKVAVTTLAFCVAALLALGMVMLYSTSMGMVMRASGTFQVGTHYLMMQLIWCALGLGLCMTATSLDYRLLKKVAWPLFILAVVLLALVLEKHLGSVRGHARRWFSFGGVSFQPSELAKLALIILLAWYGERFQRQMHTLVRGIVWPGLLICPVLGLIFVEPDRGTTVLLAAVGGAMLLIAGVRWKYFVPPIVLGIIALAVSIWHDPMRMKRIFSWLDLEEHKSGVGYQAYQAMLALGSGGWSGLGLIATLLVVVAFVVIVICGIYVALNARDTFGFLLGSGLTFLIGLQAFINIGVVTSALPNKGLPLPFISYGGSNLLAMLTCVGLLFSIARQSRVREEAM